MTEKRKAPDVPGGLLGNILSGLGAMPAQPKRPRACERNMGMDPFQALAQKLHQIRDEFHIKLQQLSPGCAVEIEAKLGLLVSAQTDGRMGPFTPGAGAIVLVPQTLKDKHLRFKSGVSKKDFEAYRAVQEETLKRPGNHKNPALTHAYTFGNERRVQTDSAGIVIMEHKTRELEFNVHLPSCPYDCRVTVSIERPLEAIERQEVGQDWESKRAKDRCSYSDGRSKWRADLTKVTTTQGSHHFNPGHPGGMDAERTFEVELELKAEDCTQWIRLGDAEAAKKRTSEVAQDLWLRISAMMPCEETAGQLKEVKDAELEIAGQRACLAPFEKEGGATSGRSSNDFPGTMPVGFSKKHIEKVQREKYWVSEKTDGVRHFLVVVQLDKRSPTALLYDRKFKAWQMDGMEGLGEALGVGTVLDGEVVRNRSWKRDIFMVFDCMSVGGVSCVLEPFSNRLKRLEKDVMGQRYLKYLHEKQEQMNEKMKTLPVVLKLFKEITQGNNGVKEITRHIRFEGADRVYLELDAQGTPIGQKRDAQGKPIAQKRHHKTDGLIFAPELPYHRGTDHNYLKWKWHDTITLDFECCRTQNPKFPHGVELKFAAECGQVDFSDNIVLGAHERHRLLGDLGSMHNLITEWEWSPECSGWVYKMPRPDKDRPNFSRTVLNTLMELAEGMDIEELEYRLSFSNPEDDDWVEALATRRKALLAERRRSVANGT